MAALATGNRKNPCRCSSTDRGFRVHNNSKNTIAMAVSSVPHRVSVESKIDEKQRLDNLKADMQADAEEEAKKRMRIAGIFGEMVAAEPFHQRHLLNRAVQDMSDAALAAFIDMAEDDAESLDPDDDHEAWALVNTALTTAYMQRNLRGV